MNSAVETVEIANVSCIIDNDYQNLGFTVGRDRDHNGTEHCTGSCEAVSLGDEVTLPSVKFSGRTEFQTQTYLISVWMRYIFNPPIWHFSCSFQDMEGPGIKSSILAPLS